MNAVHPLKPRNTIENSNISHATLETRDNFDWEDKASQNDKVSK